MTPLHYIGEWLRESLALIPMPLVRLLFVIVPLAVLFWVVTLPAESTKPEESSVHWCENLKVWAVLALLIQAAIYTWM